MATKKAYITTYSKLHMTPSAPLPEDIRIEDIAHALSFLCRGNGHYAQFHSVAQHSINCCYEAIARQLPLRVQLGCLLHDSTEAYLSDITRPVKQHLPAYLSLEQKLLSVIFQVFSVFPLTRQEYDAIFEIDDHILYFEFLHFMGEALPIQQAYLQSQPDFSVQPFGAVEDCFLRLYFDLHTKQERRNIL